MYPHSMQKSRTADFRSLVLELPTRATKKQSTLSTTTGLSANFDCVDESLNSDKHDWQLLSLKNRQTCSKSHARNVRLQRDAGATRQPHVQ